MSWSGGFEDFENIGNQSVSGSTFRRQQNTGYQASYNIAQSSSSEIVNISQLVSGVLSEKIVGIVIAKEDAKHFPSKKDPSSERYLLSFTMRDSPTDFINVTCWGGDQFITNLSQEFHIGDVVELCHISVQNKPSDGSEEKFRPWTPSAYCLNISENKGTVTVVTEWHLDQMSHLLHVPTKPENDYYTIGDIVANGQSLNGEYINVLAVVKQVGTAKEVTSKMGKKLTRCEVKLFDDTSPNLELMLWDKELINLAESWAPKDHVLFAVDVRTSYNDYRKCMVITATSKTVFTVNPDTRDAHKLYQYAQTAEIEENEPMEVSFQDGGNVDLSTIHDVYTITHLKMKQTMKTEGGAPVYGITFATITTMDIDNDTFSIIAVRCTKCRFRVDSLTGVCRNQNCPQSCLLDAQTTDTETTYDLRLALSDHSGTLSGCRVVSEVATRMMGCAPLQFQQLSGEQKTDIKWRFLLERCKIYFKMFPATFERPQPMVKILSCERADLQEIIQYL